MSSPQLTIDGNEAVALVAYRLNEVIAIYPITPASPMGEWADAWAAEGRPNLWGTVPAVVELQRQEILLALALVVTAGSVKLPAQLMPVVEQVL